MSGRRVAGVAALMLGLACLSGCSGATAGAPRCSAVERVALIAQSVPSGTYVPCLDPLPPGWGSSNFSVRSGGASFVLRSDRAQHPVTVHLRPSCRLPIATPIAPRTPGGRTYLALGGIDPDYTGTMFDLFPGGCVTYRFDFRRGPHIALMTELQQAVAFVSRSDLRRAVRVRLGVGLDP